MSLIVKIHRSGNEGVEEGVVPLIPISPIKKMFLSPQLWAQQVWRVYSFKEKILPPENKAMVPLN